MSGFVPVKLSYNSFEPSGGADEKLNPIIFIHGMLLSKASWDDIPQVIANKTKRKTYAYDVRNHGDSEHTDKFNFDLNVEDLFHFMDSLNIWRAVLVGHSMGGNTAIRAALKEPARVESIFVEDMNIKRISEEVLKLTLNFAEWMKQAVESVPSNLSETDVNKYVIDQIFTKFPPDVSFAKEKDSLCKTNWNFKRKADGTYDVKFNINALRQVLKNSENLMSEPSGNFDGPAYFLYGRLSTLSVSSEADHIRKYFPNAKFVEFEEATHHVHVEYPEKFTETIVGFL